MPGGDVIVTDERDQEEADYQTYRVAVHHEPSGTARVFDVVAESRVDAQHVAMSYAFLKHGWRSIRSIPVIGKLERVTRARVDEVRRIKRAS